MNVHIASIDIQVNRINVEVVRRDMNGKAVPFVEAKFYGDPSVEKTWDRLFTALCV